MQLLALVVNAFKIKFKEFLLNRNILDFFLVCPKNTYVFFMK